ncbi:unnamed protein product [Periconia digitata]|uniref:Uncharacterized protein n=1 Tax=Periconia digitata TaxID=1303443 RepID=A0A9W4UIA9_9PLEO|nr:unnamed protein product [Periconia digitata]
MDDEEINDDMLAAMGFSSFGGTKKRKFDHTNSPKTGPDVSGANTTQLGTRPKIKKDNDMGAFGADNTTGDTGSKEKQKQKQPAPSGLAAFLNRGQNLPNKPPMSTTNEARQPTPIGHQNQDATFMVSFGGPSIPRAELNALRTGVLASNGKDTAYFLPSFVEDPWSSSRKA